jgi:hypothetical protein
MITQNPIEVLLRQGERDFLLEAMSLIAREPRYTIEDFMIKNRMRVDDYVINYYHTENGRDEEFQKLETIVAMEAMTWIYHKYILGDKEMIEAISQYRIM